MDRETEYYGITMTEMELTEVMINTKVYGVFFSKPGYEMLKRKFKIMQST